MKNNTLDFSVLISVYIKENRDFLSYSLESIFNQVLIPKEVILVEDGPLTSDLYAVINEFQSKFPELKTVSLPTNQGLGRALNEGLKHCSYELVARMDTDDIAKPDRFQKQVEIFSQYPDVDVCGAWIDEFENKVTNVISTRKLPETHEEIALYAKKRCPLNHPVVMFKKSAVIAAGGYQHFPLFEDYYLWVRMLMNGARFYNIQESLLYFRFSPDMFKRRGGWKYAMDETRFQRFLFKRQFISFPELVKNVGVRFCVRLMPNSLRTFIYKKLLRK